MSTKGRSLPTTSEIIAYLDRFVLGQERAKRDLAVAIYNHYLAQAYRDSGLVPFEDFGKQHLLLLGPSGSGKSLMVDSVAKLLGVTVHKQSAKDLVESGYVGTKVNELVEGLLAKAKGDAFVAQRGIIFIDEIDKIRKQGSGYRDISGEGVQNSLLTLLDGCEVDVESKRVDTSRILFICTGAFVGLDDIVRDRLGGAETEFGFLASYSVPDDTPDKSVYEALCRVEADDLVRFGLIPEFIGRFSTLSPLRKLSTGELQRVLMEVEDSVLHKQTRLFDEHGIKLVFEPEALVALSERAAAFGTGARALRKLVLMSLDDVDWRLYELAESGAKSVVINEKVVRGEEKPLVEGQGQPDENVINRLDMMRERALLPESPQGELRGSEAASEGRRLTDLNAVSEETIRDLIEYALHKLDWDNTKGTAKWWWQEFLHKYHHRPGVVLHLCEELVWRKVTIQEFFDKIRDSGTFNIQANLHYLDYIMVKEDDPSEDRRIAPF